MLVTLTLVVGLTVKVSFTKPNTSKTTLCAGSPLALAREQAAFLPAALGPRFCVNPQTEWHSKGLFNLRAVVHPPVPQSRDKTTSSSIYHDFDLFFFKKHKNIHIHLVIMSYKLCYNLNEK